MKTGVGIMNSICDVIFQTNEHQVVALHLAMLPLVHCAQLVCLLVGSDRRTAECKRMYEH
jgi:hypothetical protein